MGALTGLTSAGFVVSLAVVASVAVAACVWMLPRYSGPGRGQVAARTGLLAGSEAFLLLALLVLVNSAMGFYSSWRDLFGVSSGAVRVTDRPAEVPPRTPALPPPSRDALTRTLPPADGRLDALDVRGPRSGITTRAYVYVPPAYGHVRRRYPVVLFLAPPRQAILRQRLPRLVAREIGAGRMPRALVVIASPPPCVDVPGGAQGETFVSQDLPDAIRVAYHVGGAPGDWSVAGPGREGYCAALLAMRHSDLFGSAVFTAADVAPPPGDLYGGSRFIRDEYDPRWRLRYRPPQPVSVGVVADDGFAAEARSPMRADALPATAWQSPSAVLRWIGAHLTSRSRR